MWLPTPQEEEGGALGAKEFGLGPYLLERRLSWDAESRKERLEASHITQAVAGFSAMSGGAKQRQTLLARPLGQRLPRYLHDLFLPPCPYSSLGVTFDSG